MTDFKTVIRLFSGAGIECVIVGGLAATSHGSARLTARSSPGSSRRAALLEERGDHSNG